MIKLYFPGASHSVLTDIQLAAPGTILQSKGNGDVLLIKKILHNILFYNFIIHHISKASVAKFPQCSDETN